MTTPTETPARAPRGRWSQDGASILALLQAQDPTVRCPVGWVRDALGLTTKQLQRGIRAVAGEIRRGYDAGVQSGQHWLQALRVTCQVCAGTGDRADTSEELVPVRCHPCRGRGTVRSR
jgi:hypothetical protein